MSDILLKISDYSNDSRGSALCIVTRSLGSAPGKTGAKMIVFSDGSIEGTVGGGNIEKKVIADALEIIQSQLPKLFEYNLSKDLSMACGGEMCVYIEPLRKPHKLYIFGAGHIGKSLAELTPGFGFDTSLVDWRTELFEKPETVKYKQIRKPYLEAIQDISFDHSTFCVIVTPEHESDEQVLAALGGRDLAYLGLIGSKRKIETIRKNMLDKKILNEEQLNRVDMPIGIKFKAITPAEIAISILAKLIDVRNSG